MNWTTRSPWALGALMAAIATLTLVPGRADAQREAFFQKLQADTQLSVRKGLDYLQNKQNDDGSWTEKIGRKVHMHYEGSLGKHVGVTSLACMAFLAHGSLPDRGPYHESLQRGLNFVLRSVQQNGFITNQNSRMYSHAFATLFLAEVYGTTQNEEVHRKLKNSVALIVKAQNEAGGWRYQPAAPDSDMSITVCQVMALRAARNAGIHVPKATIDKAIKYVKDSFRESRGSFLYQAQIDQWGRREPSRDSFSLAAAGVTALYGAGEYEGPYIRGGLKYMREQRFPRSRARNSFDYYYGMYYGTQAAFQAGGEYWSEWYASVWTDLLWLQQRDGSWKDQVGRNYATAMACVILQIPYQYLPIFER
ncbi:MAG: prenyltransferase [Planctomycetota bacterium]